MKFELNQKVVTKQYSGYTGNIMQVNTAIVTRITKTLVIVKNQYNNTCKYRVCDAKAVGTSKDDMSFYFIEAAQ